MNRIALLAGDAHPALAGDIAHAMGTALLPVSISAFADGETRVRLEADVRDADLYIVQPTSAPTDRHLMTLALIADAARVAGAARVTAVVPYFGYARQDARKSPGEPRSAQLAARVLRGAGVERVVTLDLHSPASEGAFDMPLIDLKADAPLLDAIRRWRLDGVVIVAPDAGGLKRAQRYATALSAPLAVIAKTRPAPDLALALQLLGDVRGRPCVVVDDMASTGGTIAGAARTLFAAGAAEVHAVFVHAVMAPSALERMCAASVRRIATTDSVRQDADPRVEVVAIARLIAATLMEIGAGTAAAKRAPALE